MPLRPHVERIIAICAGESDVYADSAPEKNADIPIRTTSNVNESERSTVRSVPRTVCYGEGSGSVYFQDFFHCLFDTVFG